jgi:hypothetical protein
MDQNPRSRLFSANGAGSSTGAARDAAAGAGAQGGESS